MLSCTFNIFGGIFIIATRRFNPKTSLKTLYYKATYRNFVELISSMWCTRHIIYHCSLNLYWLLMLSRFLRFGVTLTPCQCCPVRMSMFSVLIAMVIQSPTNHARSVAQFIDVLTMNKRNFGAKIAALQHSRRFYISGIQRASPGSGPRENGKRKKSA